MQKNANGEKHEPLLDQETQSLYSDQSDDSSRDEPVIIEIPRNQQKLPLPYRVLQLIGEFAPTFEAVLALSATHKNACDAVYDEISIRLLAQQLMSTIKHESTILFSTKRKLFLEFPLDVCSADCVLQAVKLPDSKDFFEHFRTGRRRRELTRERLKDLRRHEMVKKLHDIHSQPFKKTMDSILDEQDPAIINKKSEQQNKCTYYPVELFLFLTTFAAVIHLVVTHNVYDVIVMASTAVISITLGALTICHNHYESQHNQNQSQSHIDFHHTKELPDFALARIKGIFAAQLKHQPEFSGHNNTNSISS